MLSRIDEHFLKMAKIQGNKSPLKHTKRGAVLAKNNKILSIGISNHLGEGIVQPGQLESDEKYVATVKAEMECIANAIKQNVDINGATMYVSEVPDWYSFKMVATFGIKRIVFYGPVTNKRTAHYAQLMGIQLLGVS